MKLTRRAFEEGIEADVTEQDAEIRRRRNETRERELDAVGCVAREVGLKRVRFTNSE